MISSSRSIWKAISRLLLRRGSQLIAAFCLKSSWRTSVREAADRAVIRIFRAEIDRFLEAYPSVLSEDDTLRLLVQERKSISRFGDGEYKLMVGERHKSFQDLDPRLIERMREVLHSAHESHLVAIQPVRSFESIDLIWRKFIIRIGDKVLEILDLNKVYPSMGVFRYLHTARSADQFLNRVRGVKELWDGREIVFVVGKGGRFQFEEELFNNCASVSYVYGPPKNAFAEYDRIMDEVRTYDKERYLILLVLGPTATVMAYDLALEGYQAIDFGQMPGQFRQVRRQFFKDDEASGLEH